MTFSLDDKWVWDFWFTRDGDEIHVFYLQAPKNLVAEERRHRNATIGHAVSRDLHHWRVLPDPLDRGAPGEFDDLATWTGSAIRGHDQWYLFYTGVSTVDDGSIQRVGYATSTDLITFTRSGRPPFETDPRWYEELAGSTEVEQSWRDPWVFADQQNPSLFQMLLTARVKQGPGLGRGVVAHATSHNLKDWVAHEPVTDPGQMVSLEVPSVHFIGGKWRLFYCTHERWASEERRARSDTPLTTGTYYMSGDSPLGPFSEGAHPLLLGRPYYAGRVLLWGGQWYLMAFVGVLDDGSFAGELSSPIPLEITEEGDLRVNPYREFSRS